MFPGVPAFFFISGFLISRAWELHPDEKLFFSNRFRRLFPALWVTVLLTFALVTVIYGAGFIRANAGEAALWVVAHATLGQHWRPRFLSNFGTGNINRSLWTIPIELGFYVTVPLVYRFASWSRVHTSALFIGLALTSFSVLYSTPWLVAHSGSLLIHNRIYATPLPWVGMFAVGVLVQRHLGLFMPFAKGRFWLFLLGYVGLAVVGATWPLYPFLGPASNALGVVNYTAMCGLVLSAAFTAPALADRFLRRNDVSYSLYIIHMPVMNALVHAGFTGLKGLATMLIFSSAIACCSWIFVEKPFLKSKKASTSRHP
jgi:peptidoglycan/LPS O-acetylase OafA/YrhL